LNAELDVARAPKSAILPASFPLKRGCNGAARCASFSSLVLAGGFL
jgi:hypothetical protein